MTYELSYLTSTPDKLSMQFKVSVSIKGHVWAVDMKVKWKNYHA